MSYGLCQCGCGELTTIAPENDSSRGWVRGEPLRFIQYHHLRTRWPGYTEVDQGYSSLCWAWNGALADGYGAVNRKKHGEAKAHILFYVRAYGPIPDGLELDHLCHDSATCQGGSECPHRRCVNPDHLEPVTHAENMRRSTNRRPKRTHCVNGHDITGDNGVVRPDGVIGCRTCGRDSLRRSRARKKEMEAVSASR